MKKLFALILLFISFIYSADVKPFYFENVASDSATQQAEFDYLLKYKLFGRDYLKMGTRVIIPDKSGWNGSSILISANDQLSLGGPTLTYKSISLGNQCQLLTGPIVAETFTTGNDNGSSSFSGAICLADTNVSNETRKGITRGEGHLTDNCENLPAPPLTLSIPTIVWPDTISGSNDIVINTNDGIAYIDVPDGEGTYDLYLDKIHTGVGGTNGSKVYIRMQDGGRLTRIFVHDLQIGNHTTFQVVYRTDEGDSIQGQKQYRGNVLFYSDNNITFTNTDNVPIQGTFISTKKIYLNCNLDFAGQLLANELEIGNDFKGENFIFVPFDTPIVDIDPELNKTGGLKENDSTVVIPIKLSDTATVDVYFSYCFVLNDNVTKEDFNLVADFPVCGIDENKTVIIPIGQKVPTDSIKINVKRDDLIEPNDTLIIKIKIESGAVLPNNKTDGSLKIKIIDSDVFQINTDGIVKSVEENKKDISLGIIDVIGKTDTTKIVLSDRDTSRFKLDPITNEIILKEALDYEKENTITFTIIATDDLKKDTVDITIAVIDVNETPIIENQTLSINENLPLLTKVGNIIISDLDTAISFKNNGIKILDENSYFSISGNTLYTNKIFDYETDDKELFVNVRVYDKDDNTLYQDAIITININNVNEYPKIQDTTFTIPENNIGIIGKVNAIDPDNDSLIYSISDTEHFKIDSVGNISVIKPFDYEEIKQVSIDVVVSDSRLTDTARILVNITNINEAVIVNDTSFSVKENYIGTIGSVYAYDIDGDKIIYSVNNDNYEIDDKGIISIKAPLDYETIKNDSLIVYVTDNNGSNDSAIIKINVQNVNEPLHTKDISVTILENSPIGTILDTIKAYDEDGDVLTYTLLDSSIIKLKDSIIILNANIDYEKIKEYNIPIIISSNNDKDTINLNIKVENVNEPLYVKDTTFSINENSIGEIGKIYAYDEDGDKISYIISDTINYSINDGIISNKNPFDYETKNKDTIKVFVTDGEFIDTAEIIINIKNVNEPIHSKDIIVTIPENTPINTVLDTIKAYDEDGDKLKYIVLDSSIIKLQDSIIKINTKTDYETIKSYDIPIIILSNNDRDTIKVHIDISNVNEPLVVKDTTFSIPENEIGPIGKVNAKDEDGDKIYYSISDSINYKIDDKGNISVINPFDYETKTKDTIKVYVTDGEFIDTATIIVNIENQIEKSKVNIDSTKTIDKIWYKDTIYTNDPLVEIYWTADSIKNITDTIVKNGPNIIELCYMDPSKDAPGCDTVVVYMSNEPPIVTVAKVTDTDASINGITIVDEPDGNQYVNKEINDIKVSVKDPTNPKNDTTFTIKVDLHTIDVPSKEIKNLMIYPLEEDMVETKHEVIGTNQIKVSYTDTVDNKPVLVSYITDSLGNKVNDNYTIEYTSKINGQEVHISYETDNMISVNSNYTISYQQINGTDTLYVSYDVDENGKIQKNKEGNVGYTISYSYTNKYGNTGKSDVFVILDMVKPVVEIISPINSLKEPLYTNSVEVIWTVDGIAQDTLNIERLEKGVNRIVRCYMDKADNISCDTILVLMKNAKDIDISVVKPITEINKDKVDSFYNEGGKYNSKEPFQILIQDPITEELPEPVGIGLKVDLVLPSLSSTGGLATLDDIIQTVKGKEGILVNKEGVLISGTSTGADGSYTIPIDEYINEECNDDYKKDVAKYGLEHTPLWNVKYKMHIWIYNNNSEYVNDFEFSYNFNDEAKANQAGLVTFVVDWLADKDGYVKSADNNNLGTGAYLTKLETKSIAINRCTLPNQPIGTKVKKSEFKLTSFGYKRPNK